MKACRLSLFLVFVAASEILSAMSEVKVRLFTDEKPQYVFLRIDAGHFVIGFSDDFRIEARPGETFVLARFRDRIAVKPAAGPGFEADSLFMSGTDEDARFSLRTSGGSPGYRLYAGALSCRPDLASLLLINHTPVEDYVAGVVRAEGGAVRPAEYYRTQAVITRTYTYRYLERHRADNYNLCDGTHCQVYRGLASEKEVVGATQDTQSEVITTSDSIPVIAAFHANCGGETSPSEFVWIAPHSYLTKVTDPWCLSSPNASWRVTVPADKWRTMLAENGFSNDQVTADEMVFRQRTRTSDYSIGSFSVPFRVIREKMGLRSAWFSVDSGRDSVVLTGRGYGHGVGLCQDGAAEMARQGKGYREIIMFYYPGVMIMKAASVKKNTEPGDNLPNK